MLCQHEGFYVAVKLLALFGVFSVLALVGTLAFLILTQKKVRDAENISSLRS
jgi:hypothetical protein